MKIYNDKFCVYVHSVNGVVFYVGKGNGVRPFSSSGRNETWNRIVSEAKGRFDVEILWWFDTSTDAELIEAREIVIRKPEANLQRDGNNGNGHTTESAKKQHERIKALKKDSRLNPRYLCINRTRLARKLGVHRSYLSRVMLGKRRPSLKLALGISKELGVSLDVFYKHWKSTGANYRLLVAA